MKTLALVITLSFFFNYSFSQTTRKVILTEEVKVVPKGKKWILKAGETTRVQINPDVLKSGSLCNALFLSSPRMISRINKGDYFSGESFIIIFKNPEKVPYTNDFTYDFTIISIADKTFNINELENMNPEDVGLKHIEFKEGESLFVSNCLLSIEIIETNLSSAELIEKKKKEESIKELNKGKLENFNIPINPERFVKEGTIPEYKDKMLSAIIFSSKSVLHKSPSKGYGLDNTSLWKLKLNVNQLQIESSSGINKTYSIHNIDYDEIMKMQRFSLGDSNNVITHILLVAWSNSRNSYSIILSSSDDKEEYQFQNIELIDKQFQKP